MSLRVGLIIAGFIAVAVSAMVSAAAPTPVPASTPSAAPTSSAYYFQIIEEAAGAEWDRYNNFNNSYYFPKFMSRASFIEYVKATAMFEHRMDDDDKEDKVHKPYGGYTLAPTNTPNLKKGKLVSTDYGLMQVNDKVVDALFYAKDTRYKDYKKSDEKGIVANVRVGASMLGDRFNAFFDPDNYHEFDPDNYHEFDDPVKNKKAVNEKNRKTAEEHKKEVEKGMTEELRNRYIKYGITQYNPGENHDVRYNGVNYFLKQISSPTPQGVSPTPTPTPTLVPTPTPPKSSQEGQERLRAKMQQNILQRKDLQSKKDLLLQTSLIVITDPSFIRCEIGTFCNRSTIEIVDRLGVCLTCSLSY